MAELEHDMRDRLARTWKALVARLTDYDFPPHMVFETLAAVAADGMMDSYGPSATAHMLRLRADAIEAEEDDRVRDLLVGDGDGSPAPTAPMAQVTQIAQVASQVASMAPMAPIMPAGGFEPWQAHGVDQHGSDQHGSDHAAAVDLIGR